MRVTLVTETFAPQVNGVSRTLGQLVRVLRTGGDAVQVIHPRYDRHTPMTDAIAVRSVKVPFYRELYLPLPPFGRARRAIDAFQPDLMHIATEATLGLWALQFARRRKIPVVSSFHTNFDQYCEHYRVGWLQGAIWRYLRWFHNRTAETYVPSLATVACLEKQGFRNLVLWPRGVDGHLFRPGRPGRSTIRAASGFHPEDVVIGHVGRLAAEKNVLYLAEALCRLVQERPGRVRLLFVGDGPARGAVEKMLGPAARFAGYRAGEDLADHYAACDVFAFASRTETFGNVVLEAMASGLPVVALREGGPGEIVHHETTGILVDPDAPPDVFAERLRSLVDAPGLRGRMSEAARCYAQSQQWDGIMGQLRERYGATIARAAG